MPLGCDIIVSPFRGTKQTKVKIVRNKQKTLLETAPHQMAILIHVNGEKTCQYNKKKASLMNPTPNGYVKE
jgi:hypothetical protein